MELIRHAESVSEKRISLFIMIGCYLVLACFVFVYTQVAKRIVDKRLNETYSVIFQPDDFESAQPEADFYAALLAPPQHRDELLPTIVDSLAPQATDTSKVKDEFEQNENDSNTGNDNSSDGTGEEGSGLNGTDNSAVILSVSERMPSFPGGEYALRTYLAKNVVFPYKAKKSGIEGTVYVRFCVTSTGSIEQVSVYKGVDPMLDAEAIRVVQLMPTWIPGEQGGRKVNVWFMVSINFRLH
jgi:TonB family protein